MRPAALAAALAVLAVLATAAGAAAATRVIVVSGPAGAREVTRLGPWAVRTQAQSTLSAARAALGRPTRCTSRSPGLASASWAATGLRAFFYTLDIPPAGPACRSGHRLYVGSATLTGRAWQTGQGLHVGDGLERVMQLYPAAASVQSLYPEAGFGPGRWQLEVRTFAGDRSPLLIAVMRTGRVVAFEVALGRGGE